MKLILPIVVAAATLLMLAACGQTSGPTPTSSAPATAAPTENVDQLLSKMEQDWPDATVKGDVAFQDNILADDYIGIMEDGSTNT